MTDDQSRRSKTETRDRRYPLVYNRIVYESMLRFGVDSCDFTTCDPSTGANCCPQMLNKQEVGDIVRSLVHSTSSTERH